MKQQQQMLEAVAKSNGVKVDSKFNEAMASFKPVPKLQGVWGIGRIKAAMCAKAPVPVDKFLTKVLGEKMVKADPVRGVTLIVKNSGKVSKQFAALSSRGWVCVGVVNGKIQVSCGKATIDLDPGHVDKVLCFVTVPEKWMKLLPPAKKVKPSASVKKTAAKPVAKAPVKKAEVKPSSEPQKNAPEAPVKPPATVVRSLADIPPMDSL